MRVLTARGVSPKYFLNSDMRPHVSTLSIDSNGFELISHQTHVDDLYNDDLIKAQYNQELEDLLKQHTGADKVVIFDHTRRSNNDTGAKNPDGRRGPAVRVHADYTVKSGPQRAKDTLGEHEFNDIMANRGRVVQVNVWRPITGPVESSPLALASATSIPAYDLVATDQRFPDRVGEIYQLAFGEGHEWYYAPDMMPNEVILIKGWDSVDDGRAQFTPHGAFEHPSETPKSKPRESIESRTYLVFKG